ncbi:MAG: YbdD/YjiX family protein [Sphingomonas fennica]
MRALFATLREMGRAMVGVPSYAAYRAHMAEAHPDVPPMSERDFFRNRQEARYGAGGGGKCC